MTLSYAKALSVLLRHSAVINFFLWQPKNITLPTALFAVRFRSCLPTQARQTSKSKDFLVTGTPHTWQLRGTFSIATSLLAILNRRFPSIHQSLSESNCAGSCWWVCKSKQHLCVDKPGCGRIILSVAPTKLDTRGKLLMLSSRLFYVEVPIWLE